MAGKQLLILPFLLFGLTIGHAQSVGLVLSGGGAKGLAHIGVIKVLEENNIPIDYICGTSIGAIIGGLYAAGYSADEMEALFKSKDFYFWSTGKIQKEYRYYFKKPEPDPSWLELSVAKKEDKVKLLPPTNFIPQEQMDFAYMELTSPTNAACGGNFNNLMIPFFCIATDVNENKEVILRHGDLGEALRASMTVPLYFKPIKIENRLLFDGGIVNNFPHDRMKEIFNPDLIIGHKVANDFEEADPDDIMKQISNIVMRPTNFEIDKEDGILLETNFEGIGLLDFDKIESILQEGIQTAQNALDSIKKRTPRTVSVEMVETKRRKFNAKKPGLIFQNIQVEGISDAMQRKFIIQSLKRKYNVIPLPSLKTGYFKLIADEHIKSIRPISIFNNETGYFDLHLKVEPEKTMDINFGGNISTKPINQGFVNFNYRTYKSRAYSFSPNFYFGRFYSSLKLGGRIDYPTRFPFYLSVYSTFNRWDYFSSSTELFFEDVRPPYIIREENNHKFEFGFPLGLHGKFYSNISYSSSMDEYYLTDIFKKSDEPDHTHFRAFSTQTGVEFNSLNYKQYATEGALRYIRASYIDGEESLIPGTTTDLEKRSGISHNYFLLKGHTSRYINIANNFTLGMLAEGVLSNKSAFLNYRSTIISAPAFNPTPHSKSLFLENFRANNYLGGGLKAMFHFTNSLHLRVEGYSFFPLFEETSSSDFKVQKNTKLFDNYYLQGMAALVYQTGIGPISFSVNYYEKPDSKLYATLSFGYLLFNKRAF